MRKGLTTGLALAAVLAMTACSKASKAAGPEIAVKETSFRPVTVSVPVGKEVTWAFEDHVAHNVTADDGSFGSPELQKGAFHHRFDKPGSVSYRCTIHPDRMKGTVNVRA